MMSKAKPLPTLERINQLLSYDPRSGLFFWRCNKGKILSGSIAGTSVKRGYIEIRIDYVRYAAHRIAWLLITGDDPGEAFIDHIDGDTSNNRASNLRLASKSQNNCNQKIGQRNKSGFKGVSYDKRRDAWIATISKDNNQFYLGRFNTPELAHMAYCKAAAELHGEFARGA